MVARNTRQVCSALCGGRGAKSPKPGKMTGKGGKERRVRCLTRIKIVAQDSGPCKGHVGGGKGNQWEGEIQPKLYSND